jgi:hypothetical protein
MKCLQGNEEEEQRTGETEGEREILIWNFVVWRQRREEEIEGECEVATDRIEEKGEGVNCCLQEEQRNR